MRLGLVEIYNIYVTPKCSVQILIKNGQKPLDSIFCYGNAMVGFAWKLNYSKDASWQVLQLCILRQSAQSNI